MLLYIRSLDQKEYFDNLLALLQAEQATDEASFASLSAGTSAAQRRASGICWYPIAIRNTEPTRGDYLSVEVERTNNKELAHQFRFSSQVSLFSNHNPQDRVSGTVTYLGGDRMRITLLTEELPDWADQGKLGIDLLFDAYSYKEMRNALIAATKTNNRLIRVLTGQDKPEFKPADYKNGQLNTSQEAAVRSVLGVQDVSVIHGPPGTGKTTTLVAAITALIAGNQQQILVVAPSNTAVDLLSEKLAEQGLNVLRIGNPARVNDRLQQLTLDARVVAHADMKEAKKLRKKAAEFKNMAHKYKRSFGKAEREQRKALFDEAHRIMRDVSRIEEFVSEEVIKKAQVITATLVGAGHYSISKLNFNTVVMDEAGQALEAAAWIPILKAERVILAGDHMQLPPTVKSGTSELTTTLLEKCVNLHPEAVSLLNEQYRMNTAIMGFSSHQFYNDKLTAHSTVANRLLTADDKPFTFIDTAGTGYDEVTEGTSISNPEEAAFIARHIQLMNYDGVIVAVIAPYREQVVKLKDLLADVAVDINTVDGFQGQERDVIYISLTRSNAEGSIGFLSDYRRMNVAITRARLKLVLVGDSATLSRTPFYNELIAYAESLGGYQSVWEY
ncbi:AAA family ATPase [Mucilaginibacter sp. JRF]|uniref:AAA domain-containing protein n=1 Tax=Mucilaginibacter sp. JRF TaxID=2780088 RepID=UPI001882E72B|nr:AAA domain-containing protein [Mucilaginibacter sp. JRF]MBE9586188.1 AAA family ATPase [Mucilaginibacter sp. JRF]